VRAALRLLFGAAILAAVLWIVKPERVREAARPVGAGALAAASLLYLAGQLACAEKWRRISRALSIEAPPGRFVALYLSGMFLNLLLPTSVGGDAARAYLLSPRDPVRGAASVALERGTGLFVLLAMLAVGAAITPLPGAAWAAAGAVAGGIALWMLPRLGARASQARLPRWLPPEALRDAAAVTRERSVMAAALLLSGCFYACLVGMHVLLARRIGIALPVAALAAVTALGSLAAMLPLSTGGLGLREAAYVAVLSAWGVERGAALALGLTSLAAVLVVALVGGIVLAAQRRVLRPAPGASGP
jgi:uncharacterized membrane protein YbhN (UPF0104 family)